jgi:hypothetical protein
MVFAIPNNNTSISDLNVPRFVKRRNLAAQFDVQSVQGDWQFDDVGIFSLIYSRFTVTVELRFFLKAETCHAVLGALACLCVGG